jgi:cardiolipin synthase C
MRRGCTAWRWETAAVTAWVQRMTLSCPKSMPVPRVMRFTSLAALFLAGLLAACGGAPTDVEKPVSVAPTQTDSTFLARRVEAFGDPGGGRSGIHLVSDGPEALALRLVLSDRAEQSIDAQYYLLHDDATGHLFAGQLLKAADRGVRVRVLLDDMDTRGYDPMTAALTTHPNVEVRLFNPFWRHRSKALGGLLEFQRVNRRMHNKSMTFDNQVTIVGGRNIGDEYFAAREDSNYDDLDLLATGPVVREVSAVFDEYWNSPYAIPAAAVIGQGGSTLSLDEARSRLGQLYEAARGTEYGAALTHGIRKAIDSGDFSLEFAPARVMADPAEKAAGAPDDLPILTSQLAPVVASTRTELVAASAYFVPGKRGVEFLSALTGRGVRVQVITNSLDSTDVEPVHGHYARYRKDLLRAGVELWELRPDKPRTDRDLLGLGRSRSGLHSKAFAIDRRYLFVGSFNWDPRSANINTEMGILVDSPKIASATVARLENRLPEAAYLLRLNGNGSIEWLARRDDGQWVAYAREPSSSAWRRFRTGVYGILPIEDQL